MELHAFIDTHVDSETKMLVTYGKFIMKKNSKKDPKVYHRYKMLFFSWMFFLMGKTVSHITQNLQSPDDIFEVFYD